MTTWMNTAKSLIGTREVPGPKHNPTIISWAKRLGAKILGITVTDDETPWCGTFAAHVMTSHGLGSPPIAVRASSWNAYGNPTEPCYGAIVVFKRPGGGHVGFLAGESPNHYKVLGGNQSNAVNYMWLEKSRVTSTRWPLSIQPKQKLNWHSKPGPISTNEG